jgi:hypothetical protein
MQRDNYKNSALEQLPKIAHKQPNRKTQEQLHNPDKHSTTTARKTVCITNAGERPIKFYF